MGTFLSSPQGDIFIESRQPALPLYGLVEGGVAVPSGSGWAENAPQSHAFTGAATARFPPSPSTEALRIFPS